MSVNLGFVSKSTTKEATQKPTTTMPSSSSSCKTSSLSLLNRFLTSSAAAACLLVFPSITHVVAQSFSHGIYGDSECLTPLDSKLAAE
jgi:hypothetical protein